MHMHVTYSLPSNSYFIQETEVGLWNKTNSLTCFVFVRAFRCEDEERWLSYEFSVVIKKLYVEGLVRAPLSC
jgi:hypothetical protein